MQCKEWDDANSELFKESHDEAVHKNSYKSRLYELISASLDHPDPGPDLGPDPDHDPDPKRKSAQPMPCAFFIFRGQINDSILFLTD